MSIAGLVAPPAIPLPRAKRAIEKSMGLRRPKDVGDLPKQGLGDGRGKEERVGDPYAVSLAANFAGLWWGGRW